ncbi:SDR family NAD(P)-dependent oxidoreductase [Tomitella gaofuii]|uniref:SDR family NAD(P)-dependent oxidoreductase n=1 Tax=Tomitella gaofuii TaxID=2760083 RepID=UPI0015F8D841|nr:SDR family oxidoreductase [Tomitella gaofuii]
MKALNGRIALVTGAAQSEGIGQGIVGALLRAGADVVFSDIDDKAGLRSLEILNTKYGRGRALYLHHDVSSEHDWGHVREEVLARHGGLDILVNNAGSSFAGSLATVELEHLQRCMSVNFESQFLGLKTFRGTLIERSGLWSGGAAVVNNSSIGAYMGDPSNLPYGISKAAARMLTMCAARELGPCNVRVNSVHVGMIDTPLLRASFERRVEHGQASDVRKLQEDLESRVPLGRIGTPSDAGELVAFLCSDAAQYITASAFVCDGGMLTKV